MQIFQFMPIMQKSGFGQKREAQEMGEKIKQQVFFKNWSQ
jgi:hypothetical protein